MALQSRARLHAGVRAAGRNNFALASSSHAGKILLTSPSTVISVAGESCSVCAQGRAVTQSHQSHSFPGRCVPAAAAAFISGNKLNREVIWAWVKTRPFNTPIFPFIPSVITVHSPALRCYKLFLTNIFCCTHRVLPVN